MNRRAFLRSLFRGVAVVTIAPSIFNEVVRAAVAPANPIFSGTLGLGLWSAVTIHEIDEIPRLSAFAWIASWCRPPW